MSSRYYQGPVSDHFDGTRFFHPGLPSTDKSLFDIVKWKIRGGAVKWPAIVPARAGIKPAQRVAGLHITHIGHAAYLIQTNNQNILVDPVWADRASPFTRVGPRRHNAPAVALNDLPPIDAVLITHNHYDHLDIDTVRELWQRHHPRIITPLGNDTIIRSGNADIAVETGDCWDAIILTDDIRITIVPAYHWSSRWLGDKRMALWGGFVLETPAGVIYCAGDTAYRGGAIFREIGKRFAPPVVAILPIGAYAPRWFMETQLADPEEAAQIARDCGARQVLGVHWATFALTDEPYSEPARRLAVATGALNERTLFRAMLPGDTWTAD